MVQPKHSRHDARSTTRKSRPTPRPSSDRPRTSGPARTASPDTPSVDARTSQSSNAELLLSRRKFIFGAAGAAAAVAVVGGVGYALNARDDGPDITYLQVPESAVSTLDDFEEIGPDDVFATVGSYDLPFGTLVWHGGGAVAACLFPTDTAKPLTQAGVLFLESGNSYTVRETPVGSDEGFDIYDVRCSASAFLWTEVDILRGRWRIYTATLNDAADLGEPRLLAEGDNTFETPTIALVDDYAFWQVMPPEPSAGATGDQPPSRVYRASVKAGEPETVVESESRMCAPLSAAEGGVVCVPRVPDTKSYYRLTFLPTEGSATDELTLPGGMKPLEATRLAGVFSFCFQDIYDYGDGISNLGTYIPIVAQPGPTGASAAAASWFRFPRTPITTPCSCGGWLVVKSTQSIAVIDLQQRRYATFDIESGSSDWGDFLCSSGTVDRIVSTQSIDTTGTDGTTEKKCLVTVREPAV